MKLLVFNIHTLAITQKRKHFGWSHTMKTMAFINGRKRNKWQWWASLTAPCLVHGRTRNLAGRLCVCELFLNRDLSHTVINHRTTHKLRHSQPREPISGLLTWSSDDQCRAPGDIFSFSDEIDQVSNPGEKVYRLERLGERAAADCALPCAKH